MKFKITIEMDREGRTGYKPALKKALTHALSVARGQTYTYDQDGNPMESENQGDIWIRIDMR